MTTPYSKARAHRRRSNANRAPREESAALAAEGRYEEALDKMREHLYGHDPGPASLADLRAMQDEQISVVLEGHTIIVTALNTKLGPVEFRIRDTRRAYPSLALHFAFDRPAAEPASKPDHVVLTDEAQSLAREAWGRLKAELSQAVRNMTSQAWADAIEATRAAHPEIKSWSVERLEDTTNDREPFWDSKPDRGRPPMSRAQRDDVLTEWRRVRWENRTGESRPYDEMIGILQQRLSKHGLNYSEDHLKKIIKPQVRKSARSRGTKSHK